jgi:hypothetical protein
MKNLTLFSNSFHAGAEFSACRKYRYALWRRWKWEGYAQQVMFIGLNPSTADESTNDPTIRRCIQFAKDWGYGGLLMLNAFALRATDPRDLKGVKDLVGPKNDEAFCYRRTQVGLIVAAWGTHCSKMREEQILHFIGKPVHCLGKTKAGHPKHPLYSRRDTQPEPFWSPEH